MPHRYLWYLYARPDMQWLVDPKVLWLGARSDSIERDAGQRPNAAYVPDTESYWGVNDRFAILSERAAEAYFSLRASLLPTHVGNTESLLAAALRAGRVAVRWFPTLGTLPCCSSSHDCHARGSSGLCLRIRMNDERLFGRGGRTLGVKYVYEAQAAVQYAEVLLQNLSSLISCPRSVVGGSEQRYASRSLPSACHRPANERSPHACVPVRALCLSPVEPQITWRALWQGNHTKWYRWIDRAPWAARRGEL